MNGTVLSKDEALHALEKNKEQCLIAFRKLAEAAVSRDGKFMLFINASGELSVAEDVSGGKSKTASDNDLCIYIVDSEYRGHLACLIRDDAVWEQIYDKVKENLERDGDYKPRILCAEKSDIGLAAGALLRRREAEKGELKLYTPEQMFTKENIEYVFKDTGMENTATDEYRKGAFSFNYIARDKVTFNGDNSPNFWSLFLMSRTTFFINALTDEPFGVEFEFGYDLGE